MIIRIVVLFIYNVEMNQQFIKRYVDEQYWKYVLSDWQVYVPSIKYIYADFQYMFTKMSWKHKKILDLYIQKKTPKEIAKETNITLTRVNEIISKYL